MAKKPTVTTVSSGYASNTQLNNNFTAIRNAFDNTLSLDGSTPNAMQADLDLNSNDLLNVGSVNAASLFINGLLVNPTETVAIDSLSVKKEFTTVAALLADTSTYTTYSSGDYFRVLDGGFYYKVAASGATDHHVTTAGGVKVYVLPGNVGYDVKAFGAVGDGVTDDTAEIQAAFTASGVVVVRGTFLTSATLTIPSNTTIIGYGGNIVGSSATWVRYEAMATAVEKGGFTSNSKPMLSNSDPVNGNSNIAIYGLKLTGNLTGPNHLVQVRNVTNLRLVDMETYEGLSPLAVLKSTDVIIKGNRTIGFRNGGIDTWEGCKNVIIADNIIDGAGPNPDGSNIGIFVTSQPTDSVDVASHNAENYVVTGNVIRNCENVGIWVGGGVSTRTNDFAKNVTVSNNEIRDCDTDGILVGESENVTVSNNGIRAVGLSGIRAIVTVTGATISRLSVTGNRIHNVNVGATTGRGIDIDLTTTDALVTGNIITGSTHEYAFRNRGTNSRVAHYANSYTAGTAGTVLDLGTLSVTQPEFALTAEATWDPPLVANGAQTSTTVAVTGAAVGDMVFVTASQTFSGQRLWAEVTAADTVTVYLTNNTGAGVDSGSRTIYVRVEKRG